MKTKIKNRASAAYQLAGLLRHQVLQDPLVLSVPNGGVEVGSILASRLRCEDNVFFVSKIPSPLGLQYPAGVVSEFGDIHFNEDSYYWEEPAQTYVQNQAQDLIDDLLRRRARLSAYRGTPRIRGRDVLIVDEGILTGDTVLELLRFVRLHSPNRVLVVTPVITKYALERMRMEQLDVVSLGSVKQLESVSQVFEEFPEVNDAEVISWLKRGRATANVPRVGAKPHLFVLPET